MSRLVPLTRVADIIAVMVRPFAASHSNGPPLQKPLRTLPAIRYVDLYGNVSYPVRMIALLPHLTIGQLCEEFGVTARALRFYEDEALIAPERRGTQRLYTERDRARLAWILRGKRVGLSLSDIKELLDLYDVGDGRRTQRLKTIERCQAKVTALKQQRVDIDATIDELTSFIALVEARTDQKG